MRAQDMLLGDFTEDALHQQNSTLQRFMSVCGFSLLIQSPSHHPYSWASRCREDPGMSQNRGILGRHGSRCCWECTCSVSKVQASCPNPCTTHKCYHRSTI